MAKKITWRLVLTGVCSMVLTLVLCVFVFYTVMEQQAKEDLRVAADVVSAADDPDPAAWALEEYSNEGLHITLLNEAGAVLFHSADEDGVPGLACPEVRAALDRGEGFVVRRSPLQEQDYYYYARDLGNGTVLCLSTEVHGLGELLRDFAWLIALGCVLILLCSILPGIFLTKSIVRPIVRMGEQLDEIDRDVPYPELQPFVDSIVRDRAMRRENESMRREFTANVSHELKTPLTSISGYAELIETGIAHPDDVQQFARKIHRESGRLLNLVNDIIELSRLDTAQDNKEPRKDFEPVDLREIIDSCVDTLSVNAQRAYVTLLREGGSTLVRGHRGSLEEVCTNLCDNAIRYNNPGGKVVLSCGTLGDGRAYLRVADDGIGISETDQERVFERFYRVDKSRSKATGGTGLGLAIVKHLVAIHGAQLELHSALGQGTDVRVIFPARKTK